MNYDLAIIGGGAAGMAAAVFASENGVRTVVICLLYTSPSPRDRYAPL